MHREITKYTDWDVENSASEVLWGAGDLFMQKEKLRGHIIIFKYLKDCHIGDNNGFQRLHLKPVIRNGKKVNIVFFSQTLQEMF